MKTLFPKKLLTLCALIFYCAALPFRASAVEVSCSHTAYWYTVNNGQYDRWVCFNWWGYVWNDEQQRDVWTLICEECTDCRLEVDYYWYEDLISIPNTIIGCDYTIVAYSEDGPIELSVPGNGGTVDQVIYYESSSYGGGLYNVEVTQRCEVSISFTSSKSLLTLKHDNNSDLEITTSPSELGASYRIEIVRASGGEFHTLASSKSISWNARIAGAFYLRGVATICGTNVESSLTNVEVMFPHYDQIVADSQVIDWMDTQWMGTLNDCTESPNRRRERGFWLYLNSATNEYERDPIAAGEWVAPTEGASMYAPDNADYIADPAPNGSGNRYYVMFFHTHSPTTYRAGWYVPPPGPPRGVGPSDTDIDNQALRGCPGVVYDYVHAPGTGSGEGIAGTGEIPMGHPEEAPARIYPISPLRRFTP